MNGRILVAGVGNIFFGDDGFGCEVARRLMLQSQRERVTVDDYGIRGTHLAYDMLSGYDLVILIDAVRRGGDPGTVYVLEPELLAPGGVPDAHGMDLSNVFGMLRTLGGLIPEIRIVGCEPALVEEGIGLSDVVARSVDVALEHVSSLLSTRTAAVAS